MARRAGAAYRERSQRHSTVDAGRGSLCQHPRAVFSVTTKRVRFVVSAQFELLEAVTWYERQQDDVGIRFNDAVDDVAARLPMLRLKPMKGFEAHGASRVEVGRPWPYRLVIIEHEATLFIVAVEHHRRRPGYWLARMSELDD